MKPRWRQQQLTAHNIMNELHAVVLVVAIFFSLFSFRLSFLLFIINFNTEISILTMRWRCSHIHIGIFFHCITVSMARKKAFFGISSSELIRVFVCNVFGLRCSLPNAQKRDKFSDKKKFIVICVVGHILQSIGTQCGHARSECREK